MSYKDKRIKSMEELVNRLENIEGVDKAVLDDYAPSTAESGQIAVYLETKEFHERIDKKPVYELGVNLRAISQKIVSCIKKHMWSYSYLRRPEKVYRFDGESLGHDRNMYFFGVVPHYDGVDYYDD